MALRFMLVALLVGATSTAALAQITFRAASSAAADGAIQYVASGGGDADNGCPGTINPGTPAGSTGDLLIALVTSDDSAALTPSAGWNVLLTSNPVASHQAKIYWRFADGSGDDALTVSKAGAGCDVMYGRMARFSGVDATTPFDSGQPIPGANCTATPPRQKCSYQGTTPMTTGSETTVTANAMSVVARMIRDNTGTNVGNGYTEAFDSGTTSGNDAQVALSYRQEGAAGAIGPFSFAASADPNHGVLFALRPASGLAIPTPAGTDFGDVMVASVAVRPSTVTISPPAGWTALSAVVQGAGNTSRQQLFYKVATASEPAFHTWTFSGAHTGAVGGVVSYFGVDVLAPLDASGGNATPVGGDSGLQHRAQSINTVAADAMVISGHSFSSAETWTPPAGMTERVDVASIATGQAGGISLEINEILQGAAGATGDKVATAAGNADNGTAAILSLKPAGFYFDIQAGSHNVACGAFPIEVSIAVRDRATNAVMTGFVNQVNLSTSTGAGNWSVGTAVGTLNNGAANDGAATYQFVAGDLGQIVLRLAVTTASTVRVRVQDASTGVTSEGADINFITDGYVITPDPIQVAGKPQTITVVRYNNCAQSGAGGHNANNAEKIWLTLNPVHPGAATLPGAAGVTAVNPLPAAEPGANNITLAFAGGQATFTLNTTDVGKYLINMRDTNTARRGTSPWITTRPFGLAMPGIAHGTDETAPVFVAAGDNFSMTVGAYLWDIADDPDQDGVPTPGANITNNGLTPRFAWDTSVAVSANLPGIALGALSRGVACGSVSTIAQASFAGGSGTAADWCYSEVGNVLLTATATNFLDTPGVTVTGNSGFDGGAANGYVGRFRPKKFALSLGALSNRAAAAPACSPASAFTYMSERLDLAFTLTAQNTQNATTQNYSGVYGTLDVATIANLNLGARGTTDLTARLALTSSAGSWTNGVANVSVQTGILRAASPDGPFAVVEFGVAPSAEGATMNTLDLDVDGAGGADHKNLGVSTEVRFGRVRMQNALASSPVLALPVPMQTQYWNGSLFVLNADDSCTTIPAINVGLTDYRLNLGAGETTITPDPITFTGGVGNLVLSAPGAGNNGSVLLTPDLAAASRQYLQGAWTGATYNQDPSARGSFGVFGSQPRNFIFQRENF